MKPLLIASLVASTKLADFIAKANTGDYDKFAAVTADSRGSAGGTEMGRRRLDRSAAAKSLLTVDYHRDNDSPSVETLVELVGGEAAYAGIYLRESNANLLELLEFVDRFCQHEKSAGAHFRVEFQYQDLLYQRSTFVEKRALLRKAEVVVSNIPVMDITTTAKDLKVIHEMFDARVLFVVEEDAEDAFIKAAPDLPFYFRETESGFEGKFSESVPICKPASV